MQLSDYGFLFFVLESNDDDINYLIYRLNELEVAERYIGMESTGTEKDGIIVRIWRWIWNKLRSFWNWITGGSKKNKDEKIQELTDKTISNIKANAPTKQESKETELAKKNKEIEEQNKQAEEQYNKDLKHQKELDSKKISEYKQKVEKLKKEISEMEAAIKDYNTKTNNLKKNTKEFYYDAEASKRKEKIHANLKEMYAKVIDNLNEQLKALEVEYNNPTLYQDGSSNIDKSKIKDLEKEIKLIKSQISSTKDMIDERTDLNKRLEKLIKEQRRFASTNTIKQNISKLTEENNRYLEDIKKLTEEIYDSEFSIRSNDTKSKNTQKRIDSLDPDKRELARQVLQEKIETKKEELKHIYSILDVSHDSFPIRDKDITIDESYSKYGFNMPNVSKRGVIDAAFKSVNSKTENMGTHAIMLDPDLKWCASICRDMFKSIIKILNNLFKNTKFKNEIYDERIDIITSTYKALEQAVHKIIGNSHKSFTSVDYSGNANYMINQVNKELDDYAERMKNLLDMDSEPNYRALLKKDINQLGFQAEDVQKCKNLIEYLGKLQQLHSQLGGEYARILINYRIGVQAPSADELKRDYWEVSKNSSLISLSDRVFN